MATQPPPQTAKALDATVLEAKEPSVSSQDLSTTESSGKTVFDNPTESIAPTADEAQPAASTTKEPADEPAPDESAEKQVYDWRFYAIFGALVAATLLSALDGAIVAVALPTIAATLDTGPDYVWVANVYFLTG